MTTLLLLSGLVLAFANGANDNFKGVATLFGSGTTGFRRALAWATATTLLGSLAAVALAGELIVRFSGKGLVPDALTADPAFLAAVGLGAGATVLFASRVGMPISTTHALVGGLVGAGTAATAPIAMATLSAAFFGPLLLSPVVALTITSAAYPALRRLRLGLGVREDSCVCVGAEAATLVPVTSGAAAFGGGDSVVIAVGAGESCDGRFDAPPLGFTARGALDAAHFLSAGLVSFARGLNDTPKIAALLVAAPALGPAPAIALCGLTIAVGGIAAARRVAETMSMRITPMNAGQGFAANLVTGALVIGASRWGLPVSTTHVSCGALFGLGMVSGKAHWDLVGKILLAWVTTLPTAAALAWGFYRLLA